MDLVLKIAWRNIMRHRGKSLVIGLMLFVGAFIMTVGNGVVSGMDAGLRKTIVNSFTGDIVLISDKQESDNVLDVWTTFMNKPVAPVYNYIDIKKELARQPYIERILPAGKNIAMVINEEGGMPGSAYLVGIDFEQYGSMFPGNIKVVEGRMPEKNEHGAVVPVWARKEFQAYTNIWFMSEGAYARHRPAPEGNQAGHPRACFPGPAPCLWVLTKTIRTTDIRLGIKGIIEYKALNSYMGEFRDCGHRIVSSLLRVLCRGGQGGYIGRREKTFFHEQRQSGRSFLRRCRDGREHRRCAEEGCTNTPERG